MERHTLCLNRHVFSFIRHSTGLGQRSSITGSRTSPTCTCPATLPISLEILRSARESLRALPTCHPRTNRLNPTTDPVQIQPAYRFYPPSSVSALPLNVRARCAGRAVPGKDSFTDSVGASRKPLPPPLPADKSTRETSSAHRALVSTSSVFGALFLPFLVSTPRRLCVLFLHHFLLSFPFRVESIYSLFGFSRAFSPSPALSQILNLAAATVRPGQRFESD
jgi:hypothetical protein